MHELSVCQALVGQLHELVREHGARRVSTVTVRVGVLSGIEPDLLRQAYTIACAGTVADGSCLEIEHAPVRVHCPSCGAETAATASTMTCGQCGNWRTRLVSGDELVLVSAELERPERGVEPCATPADAI